MKSDSSKDVEDLKKVRVDNIF